MKKLLLASLVILFMGGCGETKPTEPTIEEREQFLYDLRSKAFSQCLDSMIDSGNKMLLQEIKRNHDSAMYYKGKGDAYMAAHDIIWPQLKNKTK